MVLPERKLGLYYLTLLVLLKCASGRSSSIESTKEPISSINSSFAPIEGQNDAVALDYDIAQHDRKQCTHDKQCNGKEYCDYLTCICRNPYYRDKETKECVAYRNCSSNYDCTSTEYCNTQNVCECKSGLFRNLRTHRCVEYVVDSDCGVNEYCATSGMCICFSGFTRHPAKRKCLKNYEAHVSAGKSCKTIWDCHLAKEICSRNGQCECFFNYHRDTFSGQCKRNKNCTTFLNCWPNEICKYRMCVCDSGYVLDASTDTCVPDYTSCIHKGCSYGEQCVDGICECKSGYYRDYTLGSCIWWPPSTSTPSSNTAKNIGIYEYIGIFLGVWIFLCILAMLVKRAKNRRERTTVSTIRQLTQNVLHPPESEEGYVNRTFFPPDEFHQPFDERNRPPSYENAIKQIDPQLYPPSYPPPPPYEESMHTQVGGHLTQR